MRFSPVLLYFTKQIDKKIFKQNQARVIIYKDEIKNAYNEIVGNGYIPSVDLYIIYAYIDDMVRREYVRMNEIFSSWPFKKIFEEADQKEWISFKEVEEFLLSVAAHEVRHRVQFKSSISLITPEDQGKATDTFLRCVMKATELFFKAVEKLDPSLPYIRDGIDKQYDAMIIEFITARLWRETRDLERIAKIVKEDAKNLLKVELFR
jgi:hypothetical protein